MTLPRGRRDFAFQIALWLGWVLAYQVARGLADHGAAEAIRNGERVVRLERWFGWFFEPELQRRLLGAGGTMLHAANWTYWLSQFVVLSLALLWVYLRRYPAFIRFRNWVLLTNMLGLVVYVSLPTAPPRLLPWEGFVDTLAQREELNQGTGLVQLVANEYAAMPSLHAADALIVGVTLSSAVASRWGRLWLLWPVWVSFALMSTANHFWLDVCAGFLLAGIAALLLHGKAAGWFRGRPDAAHSVPTGF
jgi:PAP2 superfamily